MFELNENLIDILKKSIIEKNEEIIIDATKINLQEFAVLTYFLALKNYNFEKYENGKAIFNKKSNFLDF
ncbi:MAG: hypothetical protein QXJ14_02670 [Candidatus Aenigmatarchaeota archaeon]